MKKKTGTVIIIVCSLCACNLILEFFKDKIDGRINHLLTIMVTIIIGCYLIIRTDSNKQKKKNKIKEENRLADVLRSNLSRLFLLYNMKDEPLSRQHDFFKSTANSYAENDKQFHSGISLHNQFDKVKYITYFSHEEYCLMIDRVTLNVLTEFIDSYGAEME